MRLKGPTILYYYTSIRALWPYITRRIIIYIMWRLKGPALLYTYCARQTYMTK